MSEHKERIRQQEYIDKLKEKKEGYTIKIFNQELIFKEFNNEWIKDKLKKYVNISTGDKDVKDSVEGGKYNFYIRSKDIFKIDSYSYEGEAILIGGDGKIEELIHYYNGKFDYHQRVYKISDFKGVNGKFLYYFINKYIGKELLKDSAKTTVDSVRKPTLDNFKIPVPSLEEQNKITFLLSSMDNLIELNEQKLEQLKLKKKYYLSDILIEKQEEYINNLKVKRKYNSKEF